MCIRASFQCYFCQFQFFLPLLVSFFILYVLFSASNPEPEKLLAAKHHCEIITTAAVHSSKDLHLAAPGVDEAKQRPEGPQDPAGLLAWPPEAQILTENRKSRKRKMELKQRVVFTNSKSNCHIQNHYIYIYIKKK